MTDRIIDISDRPAFLSVKNSLLIVRFGPVAPISDRRPEETIDETEEIRRSATGATIPLSDLAVVIASNPQISYTHAVLSGLAEAGAVFVACNAKHMPVAMMLPLVTHSLQAERFAAQANVGAPTRKRVWQQIVQSQIQARARLLTGRNGNDCGL